MSDPRDRRPLRAWYSTFMLACVASIGFAAEPTSWTLGDVLRTAATETPDASVDAAVSTAAAARLDGARAGLLPDLSVVGGFTVGTGNVVAGGMFLPPGLGTFSGPPTEVDGRPGWQGQAGVGLRWDLLGLAARVREVDAAMTGHALADARADLAALDRAWAAGQGWLAATEAVAVAEALAADRDVRARLLDVAGALADAGLRPGQERAQAAAELAAAEALCARAEGAREAAAWRLATVLRRSAPAPLAPLPAPPDTSVQGETPLVEVARAAQEAGAAQVAAARARFLPRLELLAAGSVRAGVWLPGAEARVAPNWGVGVVLDAPLLDLGQRRADVGVARAAVDGAAAREEVARVTVVGQQAEALALRQAADAVVTATLAAGEAAVEALRQTEARYAAGLIDHTAVAAAALRARDAEIAAELARVDAVRAALLLDYARGDLSAWMGSR